MDFKSKIVVLAFVIGPLTAVAQDWKVDTHFLQKSEKCVQYAGKNKKLRGFEKCFPFKKTQNNEWDFVTTALKYSPMSDTDTQKMISSSQSVSKILDAMEKVGFEKYCEVSAKYMKGDPNSLPVMQAWSDRRVLDCKDTERQAPAEEPGVTR